MLKWFNKKKKDNKGFTLVELVIVVAILAILVGLLAPQYVKYVEKSRKASDVSNLENLVTAFKTAAADGETDIAAGIYGINITTTGATAGTVATEAAANTEPEITKNDDIVGLLDEFAGEDWTTTTLKSSKWTVSDGTGTAIDTIAAQITVENDGTVSVDYYPTWMKSMSDQN